MTFRKGLTTKWFHNLLPNEENESITNQFPKCQNECNNHQKEQVDEFKELEDQAKKPDPNTQKQEIIKNQMNAKDLS